MFEGVYNNFRMLYFFIVVVGFICDVKVKNGIIYEGIFKMLSLKFELVVDVVYWKVFELVGGFCWEDIVDIMVFKLSDVMFVYF